MHARAQEREHIAHSIVRLPVLKAERRGDEEPDKHPDLPCLRDVCTAHLAARVGHEVAVGRV